MILQLLLPKAGSNWGGAEFSTRLCGPKNSRLSGDSVFIKEECRGDLLGEVRRWMERGTERRRGLREEERGGHASTSFRWINQPLALERLGFAIPKNEPDAIILRNEVRACAS